MKARNAPPEIGRVYQVPYPFVQDTWIEHYDGDEGPASDEVPTWRPGVRTESCDVGNEYSRLEIWSEADAMGALVITVVGVYRPGRFPTRVFYTRQWRDPDGKVFGKTSLRMTTVSAFAVLSRCYRHPFELVGSEATAVAVSGQPEGSPLAIRVKASS